MSREGSPSPQVSVPCASCSKAEPAIIKTTLFEKQVRLNRPSAQSAQVGMSRSQTRRRGQRVDTMSREGSPSPQVSVPCASCSKTEPAIIKTTLLETQVRLSRPSAQ